MTPSLRYNRQNSGFLLNLADQNKKSLDVFDFKNKKK